MHRNFTTMSHRVTGFQQNGQKLLGNTAKGKIWMMQWNIVCLAPDKGSTQKNINIDNVFNAVHVTNVCNKLTSQN